MMESKLLYNLSSIWLNKAARARLDGFQNRCLRRIHSIKPAFLSRIWNATVLSTARQPKLTSILLKRQLLLLGRVAREATSHPLRKNTFAGKMLEPCIERYVRKIGRPWDNWTRKVLDEAIAMAGTLEAAEGCIYDEAKWKNIVYSYKYQLVVISMCQLNCLRAIWLLQAYGHD